MWWPAHTTPVYGGEHQPIWNDDADSYVDPTTGTPLTTWDEAMDALDADPEAEPSHVARLGRIDPREIKGVEQGTGAAERSLRYVTKYITKDLADTAKPAGDAQRAHFERLHAELGTVPCATTCANWLLYGIQPENAKPGLWAGRCKHKVHQRRTLGFTGRRVLISRQWSNKTMADHRADNRAWVRAILGNTDDAPPVSEPDDPKRFRYMLASPDDPDVAPWQHRILRAVYQRTRDRCELNNALLQRQQQLSATDPAAPLAAAA